jgi:predicted RNA-binding protein with PIN domain
VTVVFDGREKTVQVEHPCDRYTFSVIYAPRQLSADGVIEQLLAGARAPETITVASRDNMIREAAAARGAFSIDGEGLEAWVSRCDLRTRSRLGFGRKEKWKTSLGDFWENTPKKTTKHYGA